MYSDDFTNCLVEQSFNIATNGLGLGEVGDLEAQMFS
jgi:hypothetical protein